MRKNRKKKIVDFAPIATIIERARESLAIAQLGLQDAQGDDPARARVGLLNAVTYGRAVPTILEGLRAINRTAFETWYAPRKAEIVTDPLLVWFIELRNEILKDGPPRLMTGVRASDLVAFWDRVFDNPPPNAEGFAITPPLGSGWVMRRDDGTIFLQPPEMSELEKEFNVLHMIGDLSTPIEHLGQPLSDLHVASLIGLCLDYLDRLVADAVTQFSTL